MNILHNTYNNFPCFSLIVFNFYGKSNNDNDLQDPLPWIKEITQEQVAKPFKDFRATRIGELPHNSNTNKI